MIRQPTHLSTLHSCLANSHCLAAPAVEVDCPGVLSSPGRMDPGAEVLACPGSELRGCLDRESQDSGLLV